MLSCSAMSAECRFCHGVGLRSECIGLVRCTAARHARRRNSLRYVPLRCAVQTICNGYGRNFSE
eukprot:2639013-Pleurochrysis_carterae.AAC.1